MLARWRALGRCLLTFLFLGHGLFSRYGKVGGGGWGAGVGGMGEGGGSDNIRAYGDHAQNHWYLQRFCLFAQQNEKGLSQAFMSVRVDALRPLLHGKNNQLL